MEHGSILVAVFQDIHRLKKALNQAVRRNRDRFPEDFMFQLTDDELENWRSQFVTSNPAARMGLRRPPYAFTELGVAISASDVRP